MRGIRRVWTPDSGEPGLIQPATAGETMAVAAARLQRASPEAALRALDTVEAEQQERARRAPAPAASSQTPASKVPQDLLLKLMKAPTPRAKRAVMRRINRGLRRRAFARQAREQVWLHRIGKAPRVPVQAIRTPGYLDRLAWSGPLSGPHKGRWVDEGPALRRPPAAPPANLAATGRSVAA
jgi:hypothetical protein